MNNINTNLRLAKLFEQKVLTDPRFQVEMIVIIIIIIEIVSIFTICCFVVIIIEIVSILTICCCHF